MQEIKVVFFGSFQHYSTKILKALLEDERIVVEAVVSTPPHTREGTDEVLKTDVQQLAEAHSLPVFTPKLLNEESLKNLPEVDYFVVAGYGKILPNEWLNFPRQKALNVHFSLLPNYRGANPAEWALLMGEQMTGITVIEMSEALDGGDMVAQKHEKIRSNDTRESVYERLYALGAEYIGDILASCTQHLEGKDVSGNDLRLYLPAVAQGESTTPYAKLLRRDDGFVSWESIQKAMSGELKREDLKKSTPLFSKVLEYDKKMRPVQYLERVSRALHGYPGLWTIVPTKKGKKRMKVLDASADDSSLVLNKVQLSGYESSSFNQIKNLLSL